MSKPAIVSLVLALLWLSQLVMEIAITIRCDWTGSSACYVRCLCTVVVASARRCPPRLVLCCRVMRCLGLLETQPSLAGYVPCSIPLAEARSFVCTILSWLALCGGIGFRSIASCGLGCKSMLGLHSGSAPVTHRHQCQFPS